MARVSIPEGTEVQPTVPSGTYAEGCRVVSAEVREVPGDKNKGEFYLDIAVGIPTTGGMVFAHTNPFGRNHTRTSKGTGSKVDELVTQLGQNPRDFDTDELVGIPVVVEVEQRQYTDKHGEARNQVNIINIAKG